MKKNFFLLLTMILLAGVALTGCDIGNPDNIKSAEITVNPGTVSVDVTLTTNKIKEYASHVCEPGKGFETAELLFAKGTTGTLVDGENKFIVDGLEGNTTYQINVALKVS